ncbi:MAG: YfhO family protein [Muribaculaceae bacterium]|nr:YfhO family protein [Muribaculaceae bacterium]
MNQSAESKEPTGVKGALLRNPKIWQTALCVAIIAIISICFFHPDAFQGNELRQYDMMQGEAIGQETKAFEEATGEKSWWTNSLFGGMPTFQISPTYSSNALFSWITTVYGLGLPSPSNLLFMMMFGFLILMLAMNVRWQYSLIGALAWGFSTYFIIIIGAGHIWKFVTLSYIPPTIAGIIMCYRGRRLMGAALAALFAMMQISSNHIQMSYYFMFVMIGVALAFGYEAFRNMKIREWLISSAILAGAAVLAVGANLPSLYYTYEYSKSTMRGGHSELSGPESGDASKTDGLDRDYITQYSYGGVETLSLMIPNIKGGASAHPVGGKMEAMSLADLPEAQKAVESGELDQLSAQYLNYVSQYFGEPEGTNGPVYVGVIIFALFLVGCVIVKGPLKWALLALTILSVLLALGRNFMVLTDFFIDYIPMYSKFRTVESILVIAEFTIPVLAILALQKLLTAKDGWKDYVKPVAVCFGIVGAIALLGVIAPAIFGSGVTENDEQTSNMITYQLMAQGYPSQQVQAFSLNNPAIYQAVNQLRLDMVKADSLRSLFFLIGAALFLLWGMKQRKATAACIVVGLLVFIDLYTVNKRYLNHDSFCTPELSVTDPFAASQLDKYLMSDTAMNFRVMNIPAFNSPAPSYHHKMIGGYHAAKLTRYQDLIDRHLSNFLSGKISEADLRVLNMLNARYIIDNNGEPIENPSAYGNAWFVDSVEWVDGADAEMDALSEIDPAVTAVADRKFSGVLKKAAPVQPGDTIFETSYAPNRLTYHAHSADGGTAVFSEVYFPWGWKAEIDGEPVEIGRVNYLLRAIDIPAGDHTVIMTFNPASMRTTTSAATVSIILIYILTITGIALTIIRYPRKE